MFISLSKTLARFGGFRLGVGMRLSKKNMIWMSLIVMTIQMFKAMWYMMIVLLWFMYALGYGIYMAYKWIIKSYIWALKKIKPYCKEIIEKLKNT